MNLTKQMKLKTFFHLFLLLSISLLLLNCKKEKVNTSNSTGTYPLLSDYTATDNYGVSMGKTDATDWNNDLNWLSSEQNLFSNFGSLIKTVNPYNTISFKPAFPNPTGSNVNFYFVKPSNVKFYYRLVNKDFKVIQSGDSILYDVFKMAISDIVSKSDTMVRMYYYFERNDSCLYKGHGDLKVN